MKNVDYYHPGFRHYQEFNANGTIAVDTYQNTADRHIHVYSTGYAGPRSKSNPEPLHEFHYNTQDYTLVQVKGDYDYASGYKIRSSGPYLSRSVNGCVINFSSPINLAALENRALDDLSDKSRGDLDLSIDVAEWHQTAKMINATRQVEDLTRVFARRFGAVKSIGNAYLQYIYGVKPLIADAYAAADELTRAAMCKIERITARATDYVQPVSVTFPSFNGLVDIPVKSGKTKVSISFGIDLVTNDWDLSRWTSLNPWSIAWELLPYSFVADYFFNVGGYLRNLETSLLSANRFRSGYKTVLSATEVECWKLVQQSGDPTVNALFTGGGRFRNLDRTILTQYPTPYLPSFQARLGSSRLLNCAALLTTLLKSGGRPSRSAHSQAIERRVQRGVNRARRNALPTENVSQWPPGYIHL